MDYTMNIRIYGILQEENKILALYEHYAGQKLVKLPGGGLEYGEGTIECLKRELDEELNLKLKTAEHFYTQEDFIVSRFRKNEQLLTVYYRFTVEDITAMKILDSSIENVGWVDIDAEECPFELPVDRKVYEKLKGGFKERR